MASQGVGTIGESISVPISGTGGGGGAAAPSGAGGTNFFYNSGATVGISTSLFILGLIIFAFFMLRKH